MTSSFWSEGLVDRLNVAEKTWVGLTRGCYVHDRMLVGFI